MYSILWLVTLIIFGVVEAATVGLASIWFAAGALAALILSAFLNSLLVQVVVFLAVSFVTLLLVRPLAQKYFNARRTATNADRVIGQEAVVVQEIDNLRGLGQVKVGDLLGGMPWTARSAGEQILPVGTTVRVERIEGVKLYVTPIPAASHTQSQ